MFEEESLLSFASGPFIQNQHIPAYQKQLASWAIYHDVHVDQGAPMRKPAVTRAGKRGGCGRAKPHPRVAHAI